MHIDYLCNHPKYIRIAVSDNECLGTVSIFENDLQTQKDLTPWLASLYVSLDYRGRG